ncbi:chemotaxis protein CheA [Cytophagales bacterium LB-30]|uniref:Chemotaxis protein CheA n=1 Tax=Shiella aurantiaca TaxID=3058365 RepID=A0ABT8F6S4_9BACT|nr:chemotaxis protein CheA [Shiella aurantiaca]MDN4165911.1 chemotaxis protein CheA [Shiella aurantiaca]
MASKEKEYQELFTAEALENQEELNRLLTSLEKNPSDKAAINSIFRITHTLKGNAAGLGYTSIAEMAHVLEDLFGEIRAGKFVLEAEVFSSIYKSIDILSELIQALGTDKVVRYKGIKTKLEVLIKNKVNQAPSETAQEEAPAKTASEEIIPQESIEAVAEEASTETSEASESDNKISFSDLVQVPVRKLDNLLNLVGELIIERDRLIAQNQHTRSNEYSRLNRISSDLQYSVMDVRLVQVGFLFNKFHRVVRDAASVEAKQVNLKLEGIDTEIDRNILQIISDSLIHIVRNCVGHGIEMPDARKKLSKPEQGQITMRARSESEGVIIEITDDGKGIDAEVVKKKAIEKGLLLPEIAKNLSPREILMYIFEPGFSTAEKVTAISGRGVGMDVVKKAIDSVGGTIDVETEMGKGTTIRLALPSSMAVKGTLLFQLADTEYAIPLAYTEAVVSLYKKDIHKVSFGLVTQYQGKAIGLVFLSDLFFGEEAASEGTPYLQKGYSEIQEKQKLDVIVVNYGGKTVGFVVDKLLQQKEIVEKPLSRPVDVVKFIGGVTILGNGNVCLVLHIPAILSHIYNYNYTQSRRKLAVSPN